MVVPPQHLLPGIEPLTLEAIAKYPIVTYNFAFAGRSLVDQAFEQRRLKPEIVLAALDAVQLFAPHLERKTV